MTDGQNPRRYMANNQQRLQPNEQKKQEIEYWSIEGKNYIVRNWFNFTQKQEKTIN